MGQPLEDQRARVFHPEDVERLREELHEALARGKPFELEQRALGKEGNFRWFLVRYNPLRDDQGHIIRWYATRTDIEDRKRAEERMRNENLALREQIDQAFMFEEIVGASPALQTVLSRKWPPPIPRRLSPAKPAPERTDCSRHPQALATFRPGVHQGKLCVDSFLLDRLGTVWPRERRLHRRGAASPGPL
jgi:hypothetical protein